MTLHAPGASPLETRAAVQAESQGPARAATSRAIESRAALDALSSLSPAQHGALLALLQASQTRHAIEYRVSIPTLLWGQCYVTVFAGRERRNPARLAAEGQTSIARQWGFITAILLVVMSCALFGLFCLAYIAKSALGINLFKGPSPFHALYALFFR